MKVQQEAESRARRLRTSAHLLSGYWNTEGGQIAT